ncbi:MAG: hypothetical protein ACTH3O_06070, partial [Brevibacterium aurantiacum]
HNLDTTAGQEQPGNDSGGPASGDDAVTVGIELVVRSVCHDTLLSIVFLSIAGTESMLDHEETD